MRLLILEDDPQLGEALAVGLRQLDHAVDWFRDGAQADAAIGGAPYDALVLDLGLPGTDGMSWLRRWRQRGHTLPVLILTARDGVEQRVTGLDAGADDYLTKPFALAELRARVRALGRRGPVSRSFFHVHNDVMLDFAGRRATRSNAEVPVTSREWAILEVLASRAGRITTRADLLDIVWGDTSESAGNSLEVLVARLRKKFGADIIKTLRGEGYSLSGSSQAGATP